MKLFSFGALCAMSVTFMQALPPFLNHAGSWAQNTLNHLSLEEKIAQLMMPGLSLKDNHQDAEKIITLIKNNRIGGVFLYERGTTTHQLELLNKIQAESKLPLLVGQDLEWGLTMRLNDAVRYPRAMTLSAIQDNNLIYACAREIARQTKLVGVHLNASPVVDINTNPQNPIIGMRAFGDSPSAVTQKGLAYMHGLQDGGVISIAKHFPGHGDTSVDSHRALPTVTISKQKLEDTIWLPYKTLIAEGLSSIMIGHLLMTELDPEQPASLSRTIVTDILKNQLGFKGLIATDALNMRALSQTPLHNNIDAFVAGNDLLLFADDIPQTIATIKQMVQDGTVSKADLDARVLKILMAKEWLDLHHHRLVDPADLDQLHTPGAHELKKQLYTAAVTHIGAPLPALDAGTEGILIECGRPVDAFAEKIGRNQKVTRYHWPLTPFDFAQGERPENAAALSARLACPSNPWHSRECPAKPKGVDGCIESPTSPIIIITGAGTKEIGKEMAQAASALSADAHIIYVLFASPYALEHLDHAPTIVAYEDDEEAQRAAANVILKRSFAQGILPITSQ